MKDVASRNSKTAPGIPLLLAGSLISLSLLLLSYFNILHTELEIILAPFTVITLLAYGDKLLLFILLGSVNIARRLKRAPKPQPVLQQQELTLKRS